MHQSRRDSVLNRSSQRRGSWRRTRPEMSDTGFTVPDMTGPPSRFDVTVTMDHNGSTLPGLAEFRVRRQARCRAQEHQHHMGTRGPAAHHHCHSPSRRPGRRVRGARRPVASPSRLAVN